MYRRDPDGGPYAPLPERIEVNDWPERASIRILMFAAGIPTTSKQPEAAKALIQWLASPAAYVVIKKSGLEAAKSH